MGLRRMAKIVAEKDRELFLLINRDTSCSLPDSIARDLQILANTLTRNFPVIRITEIRSTIGREYGQYNRSCLSLSRPKDFFMTMYPLSEVT